MNLYGIFVCADDTVGKAQNRCLTWNICDEGPDRPAQGFLGISAYIRDKIVPFQRAIGSNLVTIIHTPFGKLPGKDYEFDQFLKAKKTPSCAKAVSTFELSFGPLVAAGVRLPIYLGYSPWSETFRADDTMRAAAESIAPYLNAGIMDYMIDSAVAKCWAIKEERPDLAIISMLEAHRNLVFGEGVPANSYTYDYWKSRPIIFRDDNFSGNREATRPIEWRIAPTLVWVSRKAKVADEIAAAKALDHMGYIPVVDLWRWIEESKSEGITNLADVVRS